MAIAAVVIDLLALVGCLGQVQALVQREELDDTAASTSFWMLQVFGLLMTAVVYLTAPYVASVFARACARIGAPAAGSDLPAADAQRRA